MATTDAENGATKPVEARGNRLGWLSLGLGLVLWDGYTGSLFIPRRLRREWREVELYEAFVFAIVAAVAVVCSLRAFKFGRCRWVGLSALVLNAWLMVCWMAQIVRPLLR
jgi:hypothetical protein